MTEQRPTETRGYSADRAAVLNRLRRIEGQVRGLARMHAEGRYCIDVLTQIAAVRSALDGVGLGLLDAHVRHCVAYGDPDRLDAQAAEIVGTLAVDGRLRQANDPDALRARLERLERQVGRIQGMVEQDRYCIDVLEEINAAKKSLEAVALGLVSRHVRTCMAVEDDDDREQKADELMAAVGRLVKTA